MDKRTIIAFILIGVIILFWSDYYKWINPPPPGALDSLADTTGRAPSRAIRGETTGKSRWETTPAERRVLNIEADTSGVHQPPLGEELEVRSTLELSEQVVVVETDYYRARLSSFGAKLTEFTLKPAQRYLKSEINLLPKNGGDHIGFRFWTIEGPLETGDLRYRFADDPETERRDIFISSGQEREVAFEAPLADGRLLRVVYTFSGDDYSFLLRAEGEGLSDLWVRDNAEAFWRGGLTYTEPDTGQDMHYSRAFVYYLGDELESLKISTKKDVTEGPTTGSALWGAVRTKYFIVAIMPETIQAQGAWMESRLDSTYNGRYHHNRLGVGLLIPYSGGSPVSPVRVYIGPLDDDLLAKVDPTLKLTMSWAAGIPGVDAVVEPISKLILRALKGMRKIIPNYGICIILFSILIKLVIWPLTRKSYQSMAAMQRLQPKIKEIKEKFKNDSQRMQKEMMALYRTEKVNPMGGCLPMLLQMPLLYGLFIVFRATIEFRRAPFMLWIKDLSLPDVIFDLPVNLPIYGSHVAVLPLVMGVTSYFQSKSTMTDPSQKTMLYIMPVFLTLIFNQFPSGLTLYYTLFNVWTLVQQRITPPPQPAASNRGKQKSGSRPK